MSTGDRRLRALESEVGGLESRLHVLTGRVATKGQVQQLQDCLTQALREVEVAVPLHTERVEPRGVAPPQSVTAAAIDTAALQKRAPAAGAKEAEAEGRAPMANKQISSPRITIS
jgi:hypothetical protein